MQLVCLARIFSIGPFESNTLPRVKSFSSFMSSLPVDKQATFNFFVTDRFLMPADARAATCWGVSRVPASTKVAPCCMSSPAARQLALGLRPWGRVTHTLSLAFVSNVTSSCMATLVSGVGMTLPVKMRAA